jgi:hypothetical protein
VPKATNTKETPRDTKPVSQEEAPELGEVQIINQEVGTVLDEMDDDSYLLVHRTNPVTKKLEYLGRLSPREATVEIIQERCGGGMFVCKEKVRNKAGTMVYNRARSFEIAGPGLPSEKINLAGGIVGAEKKEETTPETGQRKSVDEELTAIIKGGVIAMMNQQNEMTSTQISALKGLIEASRDANRPPDNSGNDKMFEMMMAQQTANTAILTALLTNRPEPPDAIEQMAKVAQIMKSSASPQSSASDTLEMMQKFIGVRQDIDDYHRGPESEPEDFASYAMKRLDKVMEMITSAQSVDQLKKDVATLPPGSQPQPEHTEVEKMNRTVAMLKGQVPRFISLAQRNKNPVIAADADFDAMSDAALPFIKELLSGDNPLNAVIQAYPDLGVHANWVNDYLGRMHQNVFPDRYEKAPTASMDGSEPEGGLGPPAPDAARSGAMIMDEEPKEN